MHKLKKKFYSHNKERRHSSEQNYIFIFNDAFAFGIVYPHFVSFPLPGMRLYTLPTGNFLGNFSLGSSCYFIYSFPGKGPISNHAINHLGKNPIDCRNSARRTAKLAILGGSCSLIVLGREHTFKLKRELGLYFMGRHLLPANGDETGIFKSHPPPPRHF